MRTLNELKHAVEKGYVLRWDDPEPIEGNDYIVDEVFDLDELDEVIGGDEDMGDIPILIHYGGGSEAEVCISELVRVT